MEPLAVGAVRAIAGEACQRVELLAVGLLAQGGACEIPQVGREGGLVEVTEHLVDVLEEHLELDVILAPANMPILELEAADVEGAKLLERALADVDKGCIRNFFDSSNVFEC